VSDYAVQIQRKALDLIRAGMTGKFVSYWLNPMTQINPGDLPAVAVHILRERRTADGDANCGPPKFVHQLSLGISGSISMVTDDISGAAPPVVLEDWMTQIDDLLLRDPRFVNLSEGVLSMDRLHQYAKTGETSLFEIRVEMVVQFRSNYEPVIVDDFETIHIESRYPSPDTDPAEVQQVVQQYDIPQN
jgi:hypothetical protein